MPEPTSVSALASAADACYKIFGSPVCISGKIDVGLIATVALFFLGLHVNRRSDLRKSRETRRHYLIALREEIGLNIAQVDKMRRKMPSMEEFRKFTLDATKDKIQKSPVITFTFFSVIFKNRTEVIQDLPDTLIKNIVEFYGRLEEIHLDCKIFDSPSYVTISDRGKEEIYSAIVSDLEVVLQHGKNMKDAIVLHLNDAYAGKVT